MSARIGRGAKRNSGNDSREERAIRGSHDVLTRDDGNERAQPSAAANSCHGHDNLCSCVIASRNDGSYENTPRQS